MEKLNKPIDFICAGAQKSGTTWLFARLNELPEFSLPPIKEFHYFDRSREYPSPNKLSHTFLYRRLLDFGWTKKAVRSLFRAFRERDYKKVKWLANWHFSNYNDDWYLSLFNSLKGITGEVTPDYSILKEQDIEEMYSLIPNAKIIFLLRNPVERVWSHYRYDKYKLKHPDLDKQKIGLTEVKYFVNKDGVELRTNYFQTLERYKEFYSRDQVIIGFYDALKDNPVELLSAIVSYLGGDASKISTKCNLNTRNKVSRKVEMPSDVEDYLKEKYYPQVKVLSETYGSYFTKWYDDLYDGNKTEKMRKMLKPAFTLSKV